MGGRNVEGFAISHKIFVCRNKMEKKHTSGKKRVQE